MSHARLIAAGWLLGSVVMAGCSKQQTVAADSARTDTPVAVASADPPPPPSRVGKMPMLGQLPADGQCREQKHEGLTTIVREVTFTGDYPERVMKVGVGAAGRDFLPINLEGLVHREAAPGRQETETIYVIFYPDGSVQSGRREYFTSDDSSPHERQGLLAGDDQAAKQLVEAVLQRCPAT